MNRNRVSSKVFLLLALVILVSVLVACGGNGESTDDSTAISDQDTVSSAATTESTPEAESQATETEQSANSGTDIQLPNSITVDVPSQDRDSLIGIATVSYPEDWSASDEGNGIVAFSNLGELVGNLYATPINLEEMTAQIRESDVEIPEEFALPTDTETASLEDYTHSIFFLLSPAGTTELPPITVNSVETVLIGDSEVAIEIGSLSQSDTDEVVDYAIILVGVVDMDVYVILFTAPEGEINQFRDEMIAIAGSISFQSSEE